MEPSAQILRNALEAYVQTFPARDRLQAHLAKQQLAGRAAEIEAALDACLGTAEDFLYAYPGGVPWTAAFKAEFEAMLVRKHPWLDRSALDRLMAFSGWLCWHEGLNAP